MSIRVQRVHWSTELVNTTTGTASSPVASNCADCVFVNLHPTATYLIDGIPLPPNASITYGCNQGEYNDKVYNVQGVAPVSVAGVSFGLYVLRKKYGSIDTID